MFEQQTAFYLDVYSMNVGDICVYRFAPEQSSSPFVAAVKVTKALDTRITIEKKFKTMNYADKEEDTMVIHYGKLVEEESDKLEEFILYVNATYTYP